MSEERGKGMQSASGDIKISSQGGQSWISTQPKQFTDRLTEVNAQHGGAVIPTIKLAKAILASRLADSGPSGYHVEALALDAFEGYAGSRSPKSTLSHFFDSAAIAVLSPTRDVTNQSRFVDEALGAPNSDARRSLSSSLRSIAKTISSSTTKSEWETLFE